MISTFKHDSQGFLVGELLDVNRELLDAQAAGMAVWRGIRSDVKAIARALGMQARASASEAKLQLRATADSGRRASAKTPNKGSGHSRGASGRFVRQVATPAGRAGNGAARAAGGGAGTQRTASAAERVQSNTSTATVTPAGRHRIRTAGLDKPVTPDAVDTRDALGRFTGGGKGGVGGGGTSDKGERDDTGLLTNAIGKLGDSIEGADQLDPTITAMKEVKEAVSPLGRGMFSMFGRTAERKKEAWYKRLIKAITGKKEAPAGTMGGGGESVRSGSFMGTLMGELAPRVMLFLMPILTAIGGILLGGLALLGGVKLGEFIYKWLTDSGLMAKIFDAVDAAKQVILSAADWGKRKYVAAKETVKAVVSDFQKGAKEKTDPVKYVPPVLDASGRNVNDPRRLDRADAVTSDGRAINDPRRLDAAPLAELPPATSMAQRAGRIAGTIRNMLKPGSSKTVDERRSVLTRQMDAAGITNPTERAAFMAQADHESGGFKHMQELGGSSYFKKYDGRKDLDNTQPGDGERFKGRGFFQLTGRANYRTMGKKLGLDLEGNPEQAASPEIAAKIATQFWADRSRARKFGGGKISDLAKAGDIDGVTQGINGGLNGAQHRRDLFASYLKSGETVAAGAGRAPPVAIYNGSASATVSAGAARIPPVSIPSSVPERIAPAPEVSIPTQLNTGKPAPINVSVREPIGQDVSDRSIAHVVSGGLGMNG